METAYDIFHKLISLVLQDSLWKQLISYPKTI